MQENGSNKGFVILVSFALLAAIVVVVTLIGLVVIRLVGGNNGAEVSTQPTLAPMVTLAPTLPTPTPTAARPGATPQPTNTQTPPTPLPTEPTARVTAAAGVNIRGGPGAEYPILAGAPQGTTAEVIGRSADALWWVLRVPGLPANQGWVDGRFVQVTNAEDVPVIPAPPLPTPTVTDTPTPTATATPAATFTASRTQIVAGESVLLSWNVESVQAVYVYPVGADYLAYGVTGAGSRDVRPMVTTTYEMRVINLDNSVELSRLPIAVSGGLEQGRWTLLSYSLGLGAQTPVLPDTQVTADFSAGALFGNGGCNTYSAGYTAFENVLQIGTIGAAQLFCDQPEGIMEQEATYFNLLRLAATFEIAAGQLIVRDLNGQTLLLFTPG